MRFPSFLRFLQRSKAPETKPPQVWIWNEFMSISGQEYFVTRFFFRERLDLPDMFGESARPIMQPFKELSHVQEARPHTTYLAVQWAAVDRDTQQALEEVMGTGLRVLRQRFNWEDNVLVEYIQNREELAQLRKEEGAEPSQWVIGLG